MSFVRDLQLLFGAPRKLSALFLISVAADAEMILSPILIRHGIIRPALWGTGAHFAMGIVAVVLILGSFLLWLLMFSHALANSGFNLAVRVALALAFVFGIWFTAQLYYLVNYRRLTTERC